MKPRRKAYADRSIRLGILLALLWSALQAFAQQSVTSATLTGRVEDSNGATIGKASIIATNTEKNLTWTAATDEQGRYRFPYLPAGAYDLKVEHAGFAAFTRQVRLHVGQTLDVTVKLSVAGVSEKVTVTTEATAVEAARTQVAEAVTPREISSLPLNGRNYLDLALLVPAASRTNTGSNQRFAETSAVPGTGISIAGQRNLNNSFIVDGLSSNDDAAALSGSFYSQEVIREFQVVTSGGIAEFGRASSGVVNIITQSGTNEWRGRLYGFFRSQKLDARNPLATRKDPLTRAEYGASIGGPINRDRTFLFSNFEQTRENRAGFITISPANVAAINSELDRVNYGGPPIETGEFPTELDSTNFFARLDHKLSESNLMSARYNLYDITSANSRTVGGLNAISRGSNLDNRDQTFALNNVTTFSSSTINEARFQFTRSRLEAPVNDSIGPAINISGVASFGTATFSPTARAIDLYELVDNISTQKGAHSLKGGIDFLYNRVNITFPSSVQGVYTFASLANFLAGQYINFQQTFGEPEQFQSNPNLGFFVQDEWRPRSDLTINAGLRYDAQWLPDPIETDANNFAPRLGVAYAPGDRKTVIRASGGIYYDRIPLRATSNALQRDGIKFKTAVLVFGQPGAPSWPNRLASFPEGQLTSITTIDTEIENSYSYQANLQVERQLNAMASVSVGYIHLRGLHLIMGHNVNVPTLSAADAARLGVPNLGRPDPRFANVSRTVSAGDSYYNGMVVSFNNRFARWASARVSYTLSKAIDTSGNFFFSSPQNSFDIRDERGLSDNDQRHRLVVSGSFETPEATDDSDYRRILAGFQLSYIFAYESALPFNIQTGSDRNFDTNVNDRPVRVGRNTGRGFDFASLDLRLSRRFRFTERFGLEAIAESFNTLNRTNFQIPNRTFGPGPQPLASFGRPTAAGDPRQIQFGLRLSF
ncbi:MAG: carboxypeptidase regulatory-like domain-containing protein [Blastocatellia bacterium]|nr:carboxypeptidase regulatory-like domain-containing protein [Blastocatellia bacterium]